MAVVSPVQQQGKELGKSSAPGYSLMVHSNVIGHVLNSRTLRAQQRLHKAASV